MPGGALLRYHRSDRNHTAAKARRWPRQSTGGMSPRNWPFETTARVIVYGLP